MSTSTKASLTRSPIGRDDDIASISSKADTGEDKEVMEEHAVAVDVLSPEQLDFEEWRKFRRVFEGDEMNSGPFAEGDRDDLFLKGLKLSEHISVELQKNKKCPQEVRNSVRILTYYYLNIIRQQEKIVNDLRTELKFVNTGLNTRPVPDRNDQVVSRDNGEGRSYAEVVGQKAKTKTRDRSRSRNRNTYSLVVHPKNNGCSLAIREKIEGTVNIGNLKGGIREVRNARDGGIIVHLENKDDVQILSDEIKNVDTNDEFEVKEPVKRKPHIVIYGVQEDLEPGEIINKIIDRNKQFKDESDIEFKTKFKGRLGLNWVFAVSPSAFDEIMSSKNLYWMVAT